MRIFRDFKSVLKFRCVSCIVAPRVPDGWLLQHSPSLTLPGVILRKVDPSSFLVAFKQWGGDNGGVLPENLFIDEVGGRKVLRIRALGNFYEGAVRGINKDGSQRSDGKRTGGAIATKEYFASGSYEVRAKLAPKLGVCSAFWTFHYQEFYPGDPQYMEKPVGGPDYYAVRSESEASGP